MKHKPSILFVRVFLYTMIGLSQLYPEKMYSQDNQNRFTDSTVVKSEGILSLRYTSDYYSMGRADSAKAPYLSFSAGYYHKSGFFLNSSVYYLISNEESRVDLYTVAGGYEYFSKKFATGISIKEFIFNKSSYVVTSELNTSLNAFAGYDFKIFTLFADASLGFSENTDVFLGLEINKTFRALHRKMRITPSFYANAGSREVFSEYYTNRSRQTGTVMGTGVNGHSQNQVALPVLKIEESNQFGILDYEAGLNVSYQVKNIRYFMLYTWTFPVNPSLIISDQDTYEEDLHNGFYWSAGIRLQI